MAYPHIPPLTRHFMTVMIEDVSTAGQIYVVPGFDVYKSDFGTLKVVPNRFQRARDGLVLDMNYWEDVSTAGQIYVVPGFRGRIVKIHTVLNGALTLADAVLTTKIGGTAVTDGSITIAFTSSAAGDIDTATPTAANTFTDTDAIEIETDGGSTGAVQVVVTLELEQA